MKTAIIINIAAYQKQNGGTQQQRSIAPISNELALAIQQLIQNLKESNPLKQKKRS